MFDCKIIPRTFALIGCCTLLSGCFIKEVVKSELSSYDEPKHEDVAHLRVSGSRNIKVYPNSVCVSPDVPGSGYPAGPQMGGQRKRDLGMPKTPDTPSISSRWRCGLGSLSPRDSRSILNLSAPLLAVPVL